MQQCKCYKYYIWIFNLFLPVEGAYLKLLQTVFFLMLYFTGGVVAMVTRCIG